MENLSLSKPIFASRLNWIRSLLRESPSSRLCQNPHQRKSMSVNAFHEKAGRSQVGSFVLSLDKFFSSCRVAVAMLPFALSRSDWFARCILGVLVSAGAAICLAPCGSALGEWNLGQAINAVTGTRLWAFVFFSSGNGFVFRRLRPRSFGCRCAKVRTLLRSPTGDAVRSPTFWPWR